MRYATYLQRFEGRRRLSLEPIEICAVIPQKTPGLATRANRPGVRFNTAWRNKPADDGRLAKHLLTSLRQLQRQPERSTWLLTTP